MTAVCDVSPSYPRTNLPAKTGPPRRPSAKRATLPRKKLPRASSGPTSPKNTDLPIPTIPSRPSPGVDPNSPLLLLFRSSLSPFHSEPGFWHCFDSTRLYGLFRITDVSELRITDFSELRNPRRGPLRRRRPKRKRAGPSLFRLLQRR